MPESLSGLLTFLFTDIEGSVRLWERDPACMAELLCRHTKIVGACVRAHGGLLVRERGEGDSTFSVYARPAEAAAAAAALQRALYAEVWPAEMPVRVRAALHTGTAYPGPSGGNAADYNSPTINRCARLRSLARGGQTFLTEATFHLLRDEADGGGYTLRDLGFHRLKDLRRPERVYQIICEPVPPGDTPDHGAGALPDPAGPFVGRRTEAAEIRAKLERGRLVTVTGLGGSGKSRLAREVAVSLKHFPDGVYWIAAEEEAEARPEEILLSALGLPPDADQDAPLQVQEFLAPRNALLVLDGCEKRRSEWRDLTGALLRAGPTLRLLVTSQAPLGTTGEALFALGPMAFPASASVPLETLRGADSLALFETLAQLALPEFQITAANAPVVTQVCRSVDGLPLGIELAAACLPLLGLTALAKRLSDPLSLPQDSEGGGRSLLSVLESSYALLSEAEQAALRALCVFEGGWDLEAAEAVAAESGGDLLPALLTLVRRSLVIREEDSGLARYRMPGTVAGYARRRLMEAGEAETIRRRHRAYFARLAAESSAAAGESESDWLDLLERECANLAAALRGFAAAGEAAAGLTLGRDLYRLWHLRGLAAGGQALVDALLLAHPTPAPADQARGLTLRGALAWAQSDFKTAQGDFERARRIREQLGDRIGVADLDNNLGNVAWDQGLFLEAETLFLRGLTEFQSLENAEGISLTDCNLAGLLLDIGRLEESEAALERSLSREYARADLVGVASALDGLGEIALRRGDLFRARTQRTEALKLRRQVQDRPGLAESLEGLAEVDAAAGHSRRAALLLGAAERVREQWECPLPPRRREARRRLVETLREALQDGYHQAWTEGYGMDLEDAGRVALEVEVPTEAGTRLEAAAFSR